MLGSVDLPRLSLAVLDGAAGLLLARRRRTGSGASGLRYSTRMIHSPSTLSKSSLSPAVSSIVPGACWSGGGACWITRSQCSVVIWLKIPTSPVVRGGAVLAVPSAPWRTMRGSLPRTGGASAGASGEGTISMRQHPCVSGCMSPCVSGGIGKSGGISMY